MLFSGSRRYFVHQMHHFVQQAKKNLHERKLSINFVTQNEKTNIKKRSAAVQGTAKTIDRMDENTFRDQDG